MAGLAVAGCEPVPRSFAPGEYPDKLSEWGLISVLGNEFRSHGESTPYDLNSALFTDYAHKYRAVWTPPGSSGSVSEDGTLNLPLGSIVTKTFYYAKEAGALVHRDDRGVPDLERVRLMETRILVHTEKGWQGLPYIWNEEQTDAVLEITGGVLPVEVKGLGRFNYIVPDMNQCKGCHVTDVADGGIQLIGLAAKHIDKPSRYAPGEGNQLVYLAKRHTLADPDRASHIVNADWQDTDASLEERARSYLDINCGHCHSRTGPADSSALYLNAEEQDVIHLGVCKPPVAAGQGTGGHLFGINPGHGEESILTFRMQSDDPGAMMPELGRSLVHSEAVQLISNWIDNMEGGCG